VSERVAIVGSRAHPNLEIVREYVRGLLPGTVVISGGADGVDSVAHGMAVALQLGICTHRAIDRVPLTRALSGRDRLFWRNTLIALDCDRMVVFPDGSKGGCWDAAREAQRFKRPVEVRWANGRVEPFDSPMAKAVAQLRLDGES